MKSAARLSLLAAAAGLARTTHAEQDLEAEVRTTAPSWPRVGPRHLTVLPACAVVQDNHHLNIDGAKTSWPDGRAGSAWQASRRRARADLLVWCDRCGLAGHAFPDPQCLNHPGHPHPHRAL